MNIYEIVDPEFKKEIEESRDLKLFPAGTVILDIDSYVNYIPLVMSGSVKVVRTEEDGREILLYYLTPGESCISSILSGLHRIPQKLRL
jgi:CRP/FNR family transcriptional regulator